MKYIDLDALFKARLLELMKTMDAGQLEDDMPDIYSDWRKTPNENLNNIRPDDYYRNFTAPELVDELISCVKYGAQPSDILLDAMVDCGSCMPFLLELLAGRYGAFDNPDHVVKVRRCTASLINQIAPEAARKQYIDMVVGEDPLSDIAIEGLMSDVPGCLHDILAVIDDASDEAADALMGVAAECRDERVLARLLDAFKNRPRMRGYYAHLLAHYGDERALPVLKRYINCDSYYDFMSLKEAIEALGGEVDGNYEFSGDADYERMKGART